MNSIYTVHNSAFCLPKLTNAGKKKKQRTTQLRKTWTQDSFESKRPHRENCGLSKQFFSLKIIIWLNKKRFFPLSFLSLSSSLSLSSLSQRLKNAEHNPNMKTIFSHKPNEIRTIKRKKRETHLVFFFPTGSLSLSQMRFFIL